MREKKINTEKYDKIFIEFKDTYASVCPSSSK